MKRWLLALVFCANCTPATTSSAVIEVRPVTTAVATLPASAASLPDQTPAAKIPLATPFVAGQRWVGHYLCPQGDTSLVLHIVRVEDREVEAMFEFHYIPQAVEGLYKTNGRWDPATHTISLRPGDWLEQPSGYVSVAMTGVVSGGTFEGKIDHPACGNFQLVLDEDEGDWE